jgi:hypothetical protein
MNSGRGAGGVILPHPRILGQASLPARARLRGVFSLPEAKNGEQAGENAGALSFRLTRAEIEALDQATLSWRAYAAPSPTFVHEVVPCRSLRKSEP